MHRFQAPAMPRHGDRLDLAGTLLAAVAVLAVDLLAPVRLQAGWHLVIVVAAVGALAVRQRRRRQTAGNGERTFRALLEAAPDAMVIVNESGQIVLVNSQTERLFGYDRRELLGHPVEMLTREPRPRTMGEGLELAALRKDGSTFPVDIALGPLAGDEGPLVSAAIRDVTERKRTERAMRDFLATLGHELRNPMAAIGNATRLLRHPQVSAEQGRWSLAILEDEGRHMTRLIDDLLDLSRVARNKIELRREDIEFSVVMDRVLHSTRPLVEERGQTIGVELPREPIRMHADPVRLAQVFSNLVDNAAKYGAPGNHIEVRGSRSGGMVVLSVRDHGQGIAADALPRLFDMFYRADRSLEQHEGGLGIGLTLVRQLVELHGGSVEAESEGTGRGSTFTVRLPVLEQPSAAGAAEAAVQGGAAAGPRRVLVVDDNRRAADSLAVLLRLDGHQVETGYDGRAALAAAERFQPQVALLDIGMPEINGYDVARRVRTERWGAGIYLVALTGLGTQEDRDRARDAGFDTHLVKPVDLEALGRILEAAPSDG
jgi:PAS domain S-box-containing protein